VRVVQEPKPYRRNFHAGISPQASVVGDDRQAVEVDGECERIVVDQVIALEGFNFVS